MAATLIFASLPFALIASALADLTPTAPGPGQTFNAGSNCTIEWDVDQSGTWKNVTIDLMSGSNNNMSWVANVAWGLDGTNSTLTPFNWTCPEVDPYAPIYFYQFTNNGQMEDAKWTTRFTIVSPSGERFSPTNATQPNGDPIPWGTGILIANGTDSTSASDAGSDLDLGTTPDDTSQDQESDGTSPVSSSGARPDDGPAATDSIDQSNLAHPDQAPPLNLTAMDKHSRDDGKGDRSGSDRDQGDEQDSRDVSGDGDGDGDGDNKSDESGDKDAGTKSDSSNKGDDSGSGDVPKSSAASSKDGDQSSTPEKKSPSSSSSSDSDNNTASATSHKATPTAKTQDSASDSIAKSDADTSSSASPSASGSAKKTHLSSSSGATPKSSAKSSSLASDPSATVAKAADAGSAAPTAALPPTTKTPHSASASADGASATKTAHAASSSNTCSCSPGQQGGISKLLNGSASEAEKVSGWIQLVVPLVIALLVLY